MGRTPVKAHQTKCFKRFLNVLNINLKEKYLNCFDMVLKIITYKLTYNGRSGY